MIGLSPGLVALLGGCAVAVLLVGLWLPSYTRAREVRRRLGLLMASPGGVALDLGGRRRARGLQRQRVDNRSPLLRAIEVRLERAALDLTAGEVIAAMLVLGIAGSLVGGVLVGIVAGLVLAALGVALPMLWIHQRQRGRQSSFLRQIPDTVSLIASTVRVGHSLLQGLEQVAAEAPEPTKSAIEQTVREIGLGAPQDIALEHLGQRFSSEDLDLIITSISVQQQVGGSLATILDEMADTLRERERIRRDIDALTAPQRYSAYVLALLPVAVASVLFLVSRDYIAALSEGVMRIVAIVAAVMILVGFLVMRRMADIDV